MAKAIMDPAEVRRFAHDLRRFNGDLRAQLTSLHARFQALGETWQDQEHAKFADEFSSTLKILMRFCESSSRHVPHLLRKAERIDEYLSQR